MDILTLLRAQWDRAAAIGFTALGLITLLLGWIGVSGANLVVKQIPYIVSGGMAGIIFVAIGAVLWVSADMRDQWRELRQLRQTLNGLEAPAPAPNHGGGEDCAVTRNGHVSVDDTSEILVGTHARTAVAQQAPKASARPRTRTKRAPAES